MISRVAESCFWLSRYLERAENTARVLEVNQTHLLDFEGDLYGRKIEVALHAFIRDEKKFDDIGALVAHMREDEARARTLLALD